MKKALRKLVPAIVMLLVAAAFVGTSTYAWFSMNRIVDVTGMSVTTEVSDSLLVAETNSEANYVRAIQQDRIGKLRPVSTVNGVDFFYTNPNNVKGNGDANENTYVAYSEAPVGSVGSYENESPDSTSGKSYYDAAFNGAYGVNTPAAGTVLYGYIDYSFYIKATNVTSSSEDLKLTTLNLLYNGAAVTEKAWRVAVFAQSATAGTPVDTAVTTSDRKAMLTLSGASNFTTGEAVASTSATGAVTYTSAAWTVDTIAGSATEYNKVTVRLWLEGEDSTCNNATFATLNSSYSLSIKFALGGSETAVTVIGSAVSA